MCEAHGNLGGVVQNTDPLHQVLLVVGLQIDLLHARVDHCRQTREQLVSQRYKNVLRSRPIQMQTHMHTNTCTHQVIVVRQFPPNE